MVDTLACDEFQWLFSVMSCVLLSLNVPIAANCCVLPALHVGSAGVTATDCNVPVPIVSVVVPFKPEAEAVIVTEPAFFPCAIPVPRIWARFGFDDFHETPARFPPVLPSLNVPTATNLIDVRTAIRGLAGLIVIPTRCAVDTVSPVEPLTVLKVAVIVEVPGATLVTSPALLIVATAGVEELHSTDPVMSCVLLSLNVPVAANCDVVPVDIDPFAGVTASDTRLAPVTVRDAVPVTDPDATVIVEVPVPRLVANPFESIDATALDPENQITDVNCCVLPSSKFPTAVNCCVVPSAIEAVAGVTEIEVRCAPTTVNCVLSLSVPTVAVIVVEPAARVVAMPDPSTAATVGVEELHVTPLLKSELLPSL